MATCTVSGTLQDVSGTAISGATIRARVTNPYFVTTIQIAPKDVSTTSDSSGNWSLTLVQLATVDVSIEYPPNATDSRRPYHYTITVPASGTANFSTLALEL